MANTIRMETWRCMTRWCDWRSRLRCGLRWWMAGEFWVGGWRSAGGDRYTEARLTRVSTALLEDLDKEAVDFYPNYDARRHSRGAAGPYPNLL